MIASICKLGINIATVFAAFSVGLVISAWVRMPVAPLSGFVALA